MQSTVIVERGKTPSDARTIERVQTKTTRTRHQYVKGACRNCQVRKVRCSGEATCSQCSAGGLVCQYRGSRRRRSAVESHDVQGHRGDRCQTSGTATRVGEQHSADTMAQMVNRVKELEKTLIMLQEQIHLLSADSSLDNGSLALGNRRGTSTSATTVSVSEGEPFRGRSSFVEGIGALGSTLAAEIATNPDFPFQSVAPSRANSPGAVHWSNMPRDSDRTVGSFAADARSKDISMIHSAVDMFFSQINLNHPSINEHSFRAYLGDFLRDESFVAAEYEHQLSHADRLQFAALLSLMVAEIAVLSSDWLTSGQPPAWRFFICAEDILSRFTWLGNGDLWTVQCLILRARYLFYIEKGSAAYDTVGSVVRLCWRLGLFDQPSWRNLCPFEIIMRQRIAWTVFDLDRYMSLQAGAPYQLRTSDMRVDWPPDIDDRQVTPELAPWPAMKPSPYLHTICQYDELCAAVWDTVYGANVNKPVEAEFIAIMDARIQLITRECPEELQWEPNLAFFDDLGSRPLNLQRQTLFIHCRANALRLILRQSSLICLRFDTNTAKESLEIASDTVSAMRLATHGTLAGNSIRFSTCIFTVGALFPLMCIIVKTDLDRDLRGRAIDSFHQALDSLEKIAPQFSAAGHTLRRLSRLIAITKSAIRKFYVSEHNLQGTCEFDSEISAAGLADTFLNHQQLFGESDFMTMTTDFNFLPELGSINFLDIDFDI